VPVPNRIRGVNRRCSTAISVTTCSGDRASSGIRSLPAWAFPSWQPWPRTGGRPRPWSWSLPRCAYASCCTGGGGSRLAPIAIKQHFSTRPRTSWTPPNTSSSREEDPRAHDGAADNLTLAGGRSHRSALVRWFRPARKAAPYGFGCGRHRRMVGIMPAQQRWRHPTTPVPRRTARTLPR
jgi:hypothetical protein